MKPVWHLLTTAALSALYFLVFPFSLLDLFALLLAGVFIDADHLLSYQVVKGNLLGKGDGPIGKTWKFYAGKARQKNFLILHFAETALPVGAFAAAFFPKLLFPLALSWSLHILCDGIYMVILSKNRKIGDNWLDVFLSRYSLTYRLLVRRSILAD